MTVKSWRTENDAELYHKVTEGSKPADDYFVNDYGEMIPLGRLLPDTRLQAIADAPRCEHGKVDKHYDVPEDQWLDEGIWCKGAPELRDLLDALTEEER